MADDIVVDLERMTIQLEESISVGNSFSAGRRRDGTWHLEIYNPWSGSTDTGFGETAHISITRKQAKALGEFFTHCAKSRRKVE